MVQVVARVELSSYLQNTALTGAIWIGCYVQTSERGVSYIGTQAALVLIMTLVQGWGPPDTIWPGVDRFAGMMGGLAMLLLVSLLIWPEKSTLEAQQ